MPAAQNPGGLKTIREKFDRRNIAWCVWDDGGFQLLKHKEKGQVQELKQALIP